MKKVKIHIGLPKTATTSLQEHVFSNSSLSHYYLGVRQPRETEQSLLYSKLMSLMVASTGDFKQKKNDFLMCLESEETDVFLISEEMFCIDQAILWQDKIKRLALIFKDFEVECLVTTRNPAKGAFSLYVELYNSIKWKCSCFDDFLNSNQALIFNYRELAREISKSFGINLMKIQFVNFETIKDDSFLREVGIFLGLELAVNKLPITNIKKKSQTGVLPVAIPLWKSFSYFFQNMSLKHYYLGRIGMRVSRSLKWVPLNNALLIKEIPYPNELAIEKKFRKSNEWLEQNHRIDYI